MQEMHLFEYAVIRVVPRVEREEFLNVGVALYCPGQRFLQSVFVLDETRLRVFSETLNLSELRQRLEAFERVCTGGANAGPLGQLPPAGRFRWLIAPRSTVLQTSPVHTGLCVDAGETLARLFAQLVE
ncbi:MAG: DUF3037 domain-containing protein [Cytophagaceae bacterium]|nr:DUF3037 domain-containing protein [Cytophagaceae bacterium]